MGTHKALPVTSTGCPTPPTPNPLSIGSSQRSSCRPQFWRVLSTKSGVWVCSYLILWLPSCLVRQLRLWPQVGVDMTVGLCMNCSFARLHCKPIPFSPLNKALSEDKEHVSLLNSSHMLGTRSALQGMSFYSPPSICISQLGSSVYMLPAAGFAVSVYSCLLCFPVHGLCSAGVLCSLHNVQCEFSCRAPGGGLSTPSETNRFSSTGHCSVSPSP